MYSRRILVVYNSYLRIYKLEENIICSYPCEVLLANLSTVKKQNLNCGLRYVRYVFSSRPIVEAISKKCLIINTCGRKRSSTLNATCDPNIDLQFATASSLVKMGNRNLLCSEAMLKEYKWRTASVQIHPLLLSDVLIGSYVLTSRYSCPHPAEVSQTVRCVTPRVLRVLRSRRNRQTEDS